MLFHSATFIVFFFIFLACLPFFRGVGKTYYVLVASYVFYAWWYPPYLSVIVGLTLLAHAGAILASRYPGTVPAIIVTLFLPLAVFKYTAFAVENVAAVMGWTAPAGFDWALPLGISFVTFTAVAYVLDVRGGRVMPRTRIADTGLYIAFFPQLIAGPILRPRELVPQLPRIAFQRSMVSYAALLFTLGAVKKVVVADGIAPHVDAIYALAGPISQPQALFALYGFTVQIYCDFSGYTDMALALAALLGVRLPRNFNRPYLAASVREFWRRWHMTLSRWLRDYLYFPLGGSRQGTGRMLAAVMVTMLLGGLWHGAAWTFVLWGGAHGLFIVVEHSWALIARGREFPLPTWGRRLIVLHLVAAAWVLFRAPGLDQVAMVYSGLLGTGGTAIDVYAGFAAGALWPLLLIAAFFLLHPFDTIARVRWAAAKLTTEVAVAGAFAVLAVCVALSVDNPNSFIYFDF